MSCKGCADHRGHTYYTACRQCAIRSLSRGPHYFESMRAGKLTDAYKAGLRKLGAVAKVHLEVRAAADGRQQGGLL